MNAARTPIEADIDEALIQADADFAVGRYEGVLARLAPLRGGQSSSATAIDSLYSLALAGIGRGSEAVSIAARLCREAPSEPALWYNFARLLLILERADEALAVTAGGLLHHDGDSDLIALRVQALITCERLQDADHLLDSLQRAEAPIGLVAGLRGQMAFAREDYNTARTALETAVAHAPARREAAHLLLAVLERQRDWSSLAEIAERILAHDPSDAVAANARAVARFLEGYPEIAARQLRELLAWAPTFEAARLNYLRVLQALDRPYEAAEAFENYAEASEPPPDLYEIGAEIYRALGKPERATTCLRRARARGSSAASGLQGRGTARVPSGANSEPIRLDAASLDRLEATGAIAPPRLAAAWFDVADTLDAEGDIAGAFSAYLEANSRLYPDRVKSAEHICARMDRLQAAFSGLERLPEGLPDDSVARCPIFIVGMPRSGTTLVEQILSNHPEVAAGGERWAVPQAIDHILPALGPNGRDNAEVRISGRKLVNLRAAMRADAPDAPFFTDKLVENFLWLGLLHIVFPNARIVHCRRHALDACLSMFRTPLGPGFGFTGDLSALGRVYTRYAEMMAFWHALIPEDRLLTVDYEWLVAEPDEAVRKLLHSLGLEWDTACLSPETNPNVPLTAGVTQASTPIRADRRGLWRTYAPHIAPLLNTFGLAQDDPALNDPQALWQAIRDRTRHSG